MLRRRLVTAWRLETNQATVQLGVGKYYTSVWTKAIEDWNSTGVFRFTIVGRDAQIRVKPSIINGVGNNDYAGVAYVTHNASQILSTEVRLNQPVLAAYRYTKTERIHVAEHELGHAIGLAHNPSKKSVMYEQNRSYGIQKVDVDAVRLLYSKY